MARIAVTGVMTRIGMIRAGVTRKIHDGVTIGTAIMAIIGATVTVTMTGIKRN